MHNFIKKLFVVTAIFAVPGVRAQNSHSYKNSAALGAGLAVACAMIQVGADAVSRAQSKNMAEKLSFKLQLKIFCNAVIALENYKNKFGPQAKKQLNEGLWQLVARNPFLVAAVVAAFVPPFVAWRLNVAANIAHEKAKKEKARLALVSPPAEVLVLVGGETFTQLTKEQKTAADHAALPAENKAKLGEDLGSARARRVDQPLPVPVVAQAVQAEVPVTAAPKQPVEVTPTVVPVQQGYNLAALAEARKKREEERKSAGGPVRVVRGTLPDGTRICAQVISLQDKINSSGYYLIKNGFLTHTKDKGSVFSDQLVKVTESNPRLFVRKVLDLSHFNQDPA